MVFFPEKWLSNFEIRYIMKEQNVRFSLNRNKDETCAEIEMSQQSFEDFPISLLDS